MKKLRIGIVLTVLLLLSVNRFVLAEVNYSENTIVVDESETINDDYFAAAENIKINGTINGNVYIAGGNIQIDGPINGSLYVAGGQISLGSKVAEDIVIFGGELSLEGAIIEGSVHLAGGTIDLDKNTSIHGSLLAAGGTISNSAEIAGRIYAAAGEFKLNNKVGKGIDLYAGELSIGSNAVIEGNLTYVSNEKATIASTAEINGETNFIQAENAYNLSSINFQEVLQRMRTTTSILSFGWVCVSGLLLIFVGKKILDLLTDTIEQKPGLTFGLGLIYLFLLIPFSLLLFVTVIGLHVGILLITIWVISIYLAKIIFGYFIGKVLIKNLNATNTNSYLTFIFGLMITTLLTTIPYVGWAIMLMSTIFGMGAIFIGIRELLTNLRKVPTDVV